MAVNTTRFSLRGTQPRSSTARRTPVQPSDDEILGLVTSVVRPVASSSDDSTKSAGLSPSTLPQVAGADGETDVASVAPSGVQSASAQNAISPEVAQILESQPQLREAWEEAQQFRAVFATPAAAQDAKAQLDELDSMFFSEKPGDHAALAARIHELSPSAFRTLAQAMQTHAATLSSQVSDSPQSVNGSKVVEASAASPSASGAPTAAPVASPASASAAPTRTQLPGAAYNIAPSPVDTRRSAQVAFFHSTNSAAVHQVLAAIETQVSHLLPSGVSAPTKTRIVGEIYRDLGSALGANRQLGHQLREAFRSGTGDATHQQAIVSLVTARARQALPSIARRVINEWTHGVVAANHEKLARQDGAAKRVEISGAGSSDGVNRKPISPRDVNYKRLSDADILNL